MNLRGDGDQFELDLYPGVPWAGRSPRGLTRVGLGFIFNAERPSHEVMNERDPRQLDFFRKMGHTDANLPAHVWGGSPSLLPLVRPGSHPSGKVAPALRDLLMGDYDGT